MWQWFEPNGAIYRTNTTDPISSKSGGVLNLPYDWYRHWAWLNIADSTATSKTGSWRVDVKIKDPWGNWQTQYTDSFQLLEGVNEPPFADVVLNPIAPIESEQLAFTVTATDNTYLKEVTVYWVEETQSKNQNWSNLNTSSYSTSVTLGTFAAGTRIEYWAVAVDNSGNRFEGSHKSVVVQPPPSPPSILTLSPLPPGTGGQSYTAMFEATGGVSPYTWSISQGSLPVGLIMDSAAGVISGTPPVASTNTFRLRVIGANDLWSEQDFELEVHDTIAPAADAASLPDVIAQCTANLPAAPTATDACEGPITGVADVSGRFGQGDYTITWTFADSHGNSSTQMQLVKVTALQLVSPVYSNSVFRVSLPTVKAKNYFLEFKNSLTDGTWTELRAVAGDGTVMTLEDLSTTGPRRFYRLRVE